tara:strand:- start:4142 stop:4849 length:708 start_codon:yes stop_codon:yes gene_type:complete
MGDESEINDINLDKINDDSDDDDDDDIIDNINEDNEDDIQNDEPDNINDYKDDYKDDGEGDDGEGDDDGDDDDDNDDDDELLKDSDKPYNETNTYSNFTINDYLEENDSQDFLQKFTSDLKDNLVINNHPECLSKNFEEIRILSQVKRDKNNIIIDELHKTNPFLTKYEKTRILGIRLKQLNNNSKPMVEIGENIIDNYIIANKELEEKKLPFIIQRPIPNNTFEYWKLQDLEII